MGTSNSDRDDVRALLAGSMDTHMHTHPSPFPRQDTAFSAARKADAHDMRAIVVKDHHFGSAQRAQMATEETGFTVLGGLTLNQWVGGLNPTAVDGIANYEGASIIWMPTITAENHLEHNDFSMFFDEEVGLEGISVLDADGDLKDPVFDVLDRVVANGFVLGTGHLSPTEAIALSDAAIELGVEDILVQHPLLRSIIGEYTMDQMRTLADIGATMELLYGSSMDVFEDHATVDEYVAVIDAVGPERVALGTDGGYTEFPPAIEMLKSFVGDLLDAGVPEDDVETMIRTNSKRIFGLD